VRPQAIFFLIVVAAYPSFVPISAFGSVLAYEDFAYPAGANLLDQDGGFGFSSAWYGSSSTTNYTIASNSLSSPTPPELMTQGNRVAGAAIPSNATVSAWMQRNLTTPLGAPGTTSYVSMLLEPEGTPFTGGFGGFAALSLVQTFGSVEFDFGLPGVDQSGGGSYGEESLGGSGRVESDVAPVAGSPVLLVVEANFNINPSLPDTFTLFVDPTPGAPQPESTLVKQDLNLTTINEIAIRSGGAFDIDEIRIGTTFADVVPVPEPSCMVLFGIGLAALIATYRHSCDGAAER
jgi:hypothetical protein